MLARGTATVVAIALSTSCAATPPPRPLAAPAVIVASRVVAASDDRSCAEITSLELSAPGFGAQAAVLRVPGTAVHDAVLDREAVLAGRVVDPEGGGVQWTSVWATPESTAPERPAVRLTETDADGYFSLMLPPGELAVDVEGFELRALRLDSQLGPATAYVDVAP